jgi:hypothetical protein
MKTLTIACVIAAFCFGTGCQTTTVEPVSSVAAKKIARGARIYVATPRDGSYNGRQYQGSGATVASAFDAALSRYADSVIVGPGSDSTAEVIATAKEKNCAYAVIPKITRWEDRATEWSGIRDKMELFVKVLSVESGTAVASAEIKGKSAWATFGGDHPEDLVKAPVQEFVAGLF